MENSISNYASSGDDGQVINVPVIFHFLTSSGQKGGDAAQVKFQLGVLNKYFGSYTPEITEFPNSDVKKFVSQGAGAGIQFYTPGKAGEIPGVNVSAINNVLVERKKWGLFNEVQDPKKGGIVALVPDRVVNIWVAELDSNNAGYAHLPGVPSGIDGIVIDPDFFGNSMGTARAPYDQGKTLVHLMGTYLGLYELWNEDEPCKDDLVDDTPLHDGSTRAFVPTDKQGRLVCFCPGTPTAMFMNFMDNSDDSQLSLFTEGQKRRMRAVLISNGLRNNLSKK